MVIPTYAFLAIAIVLAIVIGRAGTILRESITHEMKKSRREKFL
ncbi:hypothetical protein GCM10023206_00580 [Acinetobacter puyangensis]|uniref:Uncharacterized protein n=1 Tax=Acinetobacter puyangensis TaxID=1096779 RepID=A0A240E7J7_9GAMM|nr:hypothetical protein [Acinetobacter puyangensis]SNX44592.1 hypothetical protein SAMN05421731_103330 [Acinetobacter puyangensis]